jgi:hypothetical protein
MDERLSPELQQQFVDAPEDKSRSRLEPYREQILLWRRRGKTYRRIRQILADQCKLTVGYGPLYRFIQRRSRPRKAQPEVQPDAAVAPEKPVMAPSDNSQGNTQADRWAAMRDRMREDKQRPVVTPAPNPERFTYTDEDCVKPL